MNAAAFLIANTIARSSNSKTRNQVKRSHRSTRSNLAFRCSKRQSYFNNVENSISPHFSWAGTILVNTDWSQEGDSPMNGFPLPLYDGIPSSPVGHPRPCARDSTQ